MSLVKYDNRKQALIKKAQDSYVPLKRPAVVLEEDEYIDGLSEVIKREFFPDLVQFEVDNEFGRLRHGSPIGRAHGARFTPRREAHAACADTPDPYTQNVSTRSRSKHAGTLSLNAYQSTYTSEDNASFLALLDKQNLLRREKHAWHYNGNKIYSENTERHQMRLETAHEEAQNSVGWIDNRKSVVGWESSPKNALMFMPDGPDLADPQTPDSRLTVRKCRISHAATRMPALSDQSTTGPASEAGADDELEEPLVNGYGFVDEPDTPVPSTHNNPFGEPAAQSPSTKEKTNPFKIAETPARDQIHERLLLKSRRASTAQRTDSVLLRRTMATPKFKSSPVLSPAAHRMLGSAESGLRGRLRTPATKSKLR